MALDTTLSLTSSGKRHAVRHVELQARAGILRGLLLSLMQAVLVCVLIGGLYVALPWLQLAFDKPIARVMIKGDLQALDEQAIREAVVIYETDTFLGIDLDALVDRLEKNDWIAHARARRLWPDTVEITLVEQKPIAYWGDKAMVNAKGRLFEHHGLYQGKPLPRLWSELGSPAETMSHYQIFEQQLEPLHLKLQAISQSVQGDWRLELDNGLVVVLDRVDPVGNVRNFTTVYSRLLAGNPKQAQMVDMRYRHGAAIRWQETPPQAPEPGVVNPVSGKAASEQAVIDSSVEAGRAWLQTKAI